MHLYALLLPLALVQTGGKLQIKDTKVGKGSAVQSGKIVTVHYTGKLTSGKVFDSSRGSEPFKFVVGKGQVIKGWDQGLLGMKVGGKRTLTIPSSLGYGAQGAGADIPPNATLIFDIELLKVETPPARLAKLEVIVLKQGKGAPVKNGDSIEVHYTGRLMDGTKFDSSLDRGQPLDVTIGTTGLIPGFTKGLIGMKLGEKRRIKIPASQAYGDRGAGGVIPPDADIMFDLELVKIK